jgi:hypothetical protein
MALALGLGMRRSHLVEGHGEPTHAKDPSSTTPRPPMSHTPWIPRRTPFGIRPHAK